MIPTRPTLFCPALSDLIYPIRPRPLWSDLVGLCCPILLIDPFFAYLSMKNFIFFKKFIWGGLPRSGLPDRYYNNALVFKSIIIIYIFFTSFYIFLLLFILFFASFFSFSLFLSFCL